MVRLGFNLPVFYHIRFLLDQQPPFLEHQLVAVQLAFKMDIFSLTAHTLWTAYQGPHHVHGKDQRVVQLECQWLGFAWQGVDSVPG